MLNIALEGMPGAGKTSIVTHLIRALGSGFILLPEINHHKLPLKRADLSMWVYYHYLWKDRVEAIMNSKKKFHFLYDRTYYTNLAYEYACGNLDRYKMQRENIFNDFKRDYFDFILVLDVSPSMGLQRRLLNGDSPPNPWDKTYFLERLRTFYRDELRKIFPGKITFIDTDGKSLNLIKMEAESAVKQFFPEIKICPKSYHKIHVENNAKDPLLQFSQKEMLGKPYTDVFGVLGYPTMYFRQYALQLEHKTPVYLDTSRLEQLIR